MKRWLIIGAVFAALLCLIGIQHGAYMRLQQECDRYQRNNATLLADVDQYRVRDSLHAAKCSGLELSLKEYQSLRADDAALIRELRTRQKDLERITAAQLQTITQLSTVPRDTIIIRDSVAVPAMALSIRDKWYDFDGLLVDGAFTGTVVNRDSLLVVESVTMSHCIVKRWRKIRERTINVVSKNPHTHIRGIEYVVIEK